MIAFLFTQVWINLKFQNKMCLYNPGPEHYNSLQYSQVVRLYTHNKGALFLCLFRNYGPQDQLLIVIGCLRNLVLV